MKNVCARQRSLLDYDLSMPLGTIPLPISRRYRKPIFEAVGLQVLVGFLSLLILDDGTAALTCGIALAAFWSGTILLISRRPYSPTQTDIQLLRFGYLPLVVVTGLLAYFVSILRGVQ